MRVSITEREYGAISFAINQIQTEIEAASDEGFLEDACRYQSDLYQIMVKYKKARYKAREFQQVRAFVAEKNRGHLRPRDIDKMARKLLKKI